MPDTCELTPTLEDYLETIARLVAREGAAHVKDIAEDASVHMSTVTAALRSLAEKGLVDYRPYKAVHLTDAGRRRANRIMGRHEALRSFLSDILLVDDYTAEENACRMEHVLDKEVMDHLGLFARYVRECPRAGEEWVERFRCFMKNDGPPPLNGKISKECRQQTRQKLQDDEPQEDAMSLDDLKAGETATIVKVGSAGALRRRIMDMGGVKGTQVEVVKVAPLGDPIEVKIKGYNLTLRKQEAAAITVKQED
jgi:DtxR family Mn-dependent transcriptional regulator